MFVCAQAHGQIVCTQPNNQLKDRRRGMNCSLAVCHAATRKYRLEREKMVETDYCRLFRVEGLFF